MSGLTSGFHPQIAEIFADKNNEGNRKRGIQAINFYDPALNLAPAICVSHPLR
jgi:hypothetical protein